MPDILMMPKVGAPMPRVDVLRELDGKPSPKVRIGPFCFIWNVTGQPAISLPLATFSDGMPLGIQLVARPGDEATLLRVAGQLEAATPQSQRRPPSF